MDTYLEVNIPPPFNVRNVTVTRHPPVRFYRRSSDLRSTILANARATRNVLRRRSFLRVGGNRRRTKRIDGEGSGREREGGCIIGNNSTLTLVSAVEAWYRYRLRRYHGVKDQRRKPENPDDACATPLASSPCSSCLLLPWPPAYFPGRRKNVGHWMQR